MKQAGVKANGTRCSVHNFGDRKRYTPPTEEEIQRILDLPLTPLEKLPEIDNEDKYEWVMVGCWTQSKPNWESSSNSKDEGYSYGFPKYGRSMYCMKTGIRRTTTFGEFYESSTVD